MIYIKKLLSTIIDIFLFRTYHIIIFVGSSGLYIALFKGQILQKHQFFTLDQIDNEATEFFLSLNRSPVTILLDNVESKLEKESIPDLQSIIPINPISQFIKRRFSKDDIIAYYMHDANDGQQYANNLIISYSPTTKTIEKLIDLVLRNSYQFVDVYFLSLEFSSIINHIISKQLPEIKDHCLIFITITKTSGIKSVVKYQNNILLSRTIQYQQNKSLESLQDTIESEINECMICFQDFTKQHHLKCSVVLLLLDNQLINLFRKFKASKNYHIVTIENGGLSRQEQENCADLSIANLFAKCMTHPARGNSINYIKKLNLLNTFILKPMIVFMIILAYQNIASYIQILNYRKNISSINDRYVNTLTECKNIKRQYYSNHCNISNMIFFNEFGQFFRENINNTPFDIINKLLESSTTVNVILDKITWQVKPIDVLAPDINYINLELCFRFTSHYHNKYYALKDLQNYINYIKSKINYIDFKYDIIDNHIIQLNNKTIIPISINIISKYHRMLL